MLVVLEFLMSKLGIAAVGVAVILSLWLWNRHLNDRVNTLNSEAAVAAEQIKQADKTLVVLQQTMQDTIVRVAASNRVRGEITNAPETENGPIAPVVERALNLLRQRNKIHSN